MYITPKSFAEFLNWTKQGNIIPISKTIPSDLLTPVSAYLKLREQHIYSFLLESIDGAEQVARYSFLGVNPHLVLRVRNGVVEFHHEGQTQTQPGTLFDTLREYLQQFRPVKIPGLPPFTGGAVGYLTYDTVSWFERVQLQKTAYPAVDDAVVMFFSSLLAFDHVKQQIVITFNLFITPEDNETTLSEKYHQAIATIEALEQRLKHPLPTLTKSWRRQPPQLRANVTQEQFEQMVNRAKAYIKSGDIFQVVLSQRFEVDVMTDPFQIYRALRMVNPSPYNFYLALNDLHLIGSSPEMLVRCMNRQLDYRPIAGTRARGASDVEDVLLGEELKIDEKEVAEHIMLVDLGRNDLGRISEFGSVEVLDLMAIERYSHVIHMVSSLRSQLRADCDCFDALAACFPAGTVSGAPKVRAMEIIEELEPTRRGPYAGTVFYLDYSGNLNSCITIRTILVKDHKAYIQAGAGIVADSIPQKEYLETINKARALLKAIEIAEKEL
jgi:anthranilate synthase component I